VAELLVLADIEAAVIAELEATLPAHGFAAHIATKLPPQSTAAKPDEFVRVITVGGTDQTLVSAAPRVAVECFARVEARAQRLAAFALAALQTAGRSGTLGGLVCYRVTAEALPGNLPMGSVPDRARYTFTISADVRKLAV